MKSKHIPYYFLIGIVISLFNNCNIQKRTYQKGYYVSYKKHKDVLKTKQPENYISEIDTDENTLAQNNTTLQQPFIANKTLITFNHPNPSDSCADLITMLDSTKLEAKIIEITEDVIKYKRCDHSDGPLYTANKNNIAYIRYKNGVQEIITKPVRPCRDSIIFINGNKMLAQVLEVGNETIKYKSCNDLKGLTNEINKSNIGRIRYSDGRTVYLNEVVYTPIKPERKVSKVLKLILGGVLLVLAISIVIGLASVGTPGDILIVLYLLFLLFSIGFLFAMGWHQHLGFLQWFM